MAEEMYEAEIYTLTDEDGNEAQFEEIATCEVDGILYRAMIPLDDEETEEGAYVILKTVMDDEGEPLLMTIEDDEEFDRIADIFEDGFAEIDYDDAE